MADIPHSFRMSLSSSSSSSSTKDNKTKHRIDPASALLIRKSASKPSSSSKKSKSKGKGKGKEEDSSKSSSVGGTTAGSVEGGELENGTGGESAEDLADRLLEQMDAARLEDERQREEMEVVAAKEESLVDAAKDESLAMANGRSNGDGEKKKTRKEARKEKKKSAFEVLRSHVLAETGNGGPDEAEQERKAITKSCDELGLMIVEMNPDGHCLYNAIADQINILNLLSTTQSYRTTRSAAATYMRSHPDEFIPFLPAEDEGSGEEGIMDAAAYEKYCDSVEKTAVWGGQPELLALSQCYQIPVHVVQAGSPVVKIGDDEFPDREPLTISYHRKMYGLGEHYNSLHPKPKGVSKIKNALGIHHSSPSHHSP